MIEHDPSLGFLHFFESVYRECSTTPGSLILHRLDDSDVVNEVHDGDILLAVIDPSLLRCNVRGNAVRTIHFTCVEITVELVQSTANWDIIRSSVSFYYAPRSNLYTNSLDSEWSPSLDRYVPYTGDMIQKIVDEIHTYDWRHIFGTFWRNML
jgi:hypothetical protein